MKYKARTGVVSAAIPNSVIDDVNAILRKDRGNMSELIRNLLVEFVTKNLHKLDRDEKRVKKLRNQIEKIEQSF